MEQALTLKPIVNYRKLRHLIGDAVSNKLIDKFIVYGYDEEGGFSACVEANTATATSPAFEKFVKRLNNIHPKSGTFYTINDTQRCQIQPAIAAAAVKMKPVPLAITYHCVTRTINAQDFCYKYACTANCNSFPTNYTYNSKGAGACPNNPPSNCP